MARVAGMTTECLARIMILAGVTPEQLAKDGPRVCQARSARYATGTPAARNHARSAISWLTRFSADLASTSSSWLAHARGAGRVVSAASL